MKSEENYKAAQEWYKIAKEQSNQLAIEILENHFPELKESDGERIRKALKSYFDSEISDYGNVEWRGGIYYGEVISWLEKHKEQQPVEWSEEDEKNRALIYAALNQVYDLKHNKELCDWLNHLKYYPCWKPSDKQMEALRRMKAAIAGEGEIYGPLNSLYEDLKKIKGE